MTLLGYHDLTDIKLRHSLRQSRRSDVAALLDEVEQLRAEVRQIGAEFDASPHADVDEIVQAIRDARLEEREDAVELEAKVRDHEAFERGCHRVMTAFKVDPTVTVLFESGQSLANPAEFCSMCSPGHADEHGYCERHGKKVRGMWTKTSGPTQTGLVLLLALAAPLFELVQLAYLRPRPPVSASRRRSARQGR